jgi:excisionase family DNA binding protein
MEEKYWTLEEFGRVARLHLDTVRRYAREGRIPVRKIGKRYLIRSTDVVAFMEGEPTPATSAKRTAKRRKAAGD